MAYATAEDIRDRYGDGVLTFVNDFGKGTGMDAESVERALSDATDEMDPYLASRYSLPLDPVPGLLVRLCVDIALYRLSASAGGYTEEKRKRYEDAVTTLNRIAKGTLSLGLETPPPSVGGGVVLEGPPRLFSRASMRGLS